MSYTSKELMSVFAGNASGKGLLKSVGEKVESKGAFAEMFKSRLKQSGEDSKEATASEDSLMTMLMVTSAAASLQVQPAANAADSEALSKVSDTSGIAALAPIEMRTSVADLPVNATDFSDFLIPEPASNGMTKPSVNAGEAKLRAFAEMSTQGSNQDGVVFESEQRKTEAMPIANGVQTTPEAVIQPNQNARPFVEAGVPESLANIPPQAESISGATLADQVLPQKENRDIGVRQMSAAKTTELGDVQNLVSREAVTVEQALTVNNAAAEMAAVSAQIPATQSANPGRVFLSRDAALADQTAPNNLVQASAQGNEEVSAISGQVTLAQAANVGRPFSGTGAGVTVQSPANGVAQILVTTQAVQNENAIMNAPQVVSLPVQDTAERLPGKSANQVASTSATVLAPKTAVTETQVVKQEPSVVQTDNLTELQTKPIAAFVATEADRNGLNVADRKSQLLVDEPVVKLQDVSQTQGKENTIPLPLKSSIAYRGYSLLSSVNKQKAEVTTPAVENARIAIKSLALNVLPSNSGQAVSANLPVTNVTTQPSSVLRTGNQSLLKEAKQGDLLEHKANDVVVKLPDAESAGKITAESPVRNLEPTLVTKGEAVLPSNETIRAPQSAETKETSLNPIGMGHSLPQSVNEVKAPNLQATRADSHKAVEVVKQIVEQARLITNAQTNEMVIRLKPEHLGEMVLRVSVEQTGAVNASFHSSNPEVRAMIESSVLQLKQELASQGLKVDNVGVYAGLGQFLSDQGQRQPAAPPRTFVKGKKADIEEFVEVVEATQGLSNGLNDDGVDYRV